MLHKKIELNVKRIKDSFDDGTGLFTEFFPSMMEDLKTARIYLFIASPLITSVVQFTNGQIHGTPFPLRVITTMIE